MHVGSSGAEAVCPPSRPLCSIGRATCLSAHTSCRSSARCALMPSSCPTTRATRSAVIAAAATAGLPLRGEWRRAHMCARGIGLGKSLRANAPLIWAGQAVASEAGAVRQVERAATGHRARAARRTRGCFRARTTTAEESFGTPSHGFARRCDALDAFVAAYVSTDGVLTGERRARLQRGRSAAAVPGLQSAGSARVPWRARVN